MSWSASNYCFSARLPARERLWSRSSTAQGSAAASVLLQSLLGLRGVTALWAGLLATNDGLSQNGIANFASSANSFEWSCWPEIPSASTDRIWQDLIISSVFPLSVNSEVRPTRPTLSQLLLGVHMAAVVWLLCHQYAGGILPRDFSRSRWCSFPFFPEPGQCRGLDENQLADNLARRSARCEEMGKRSKRCGCKSRLHCYSPTVPTSAKEFGHSWVFPESTGSQFPT